MTLLLLEQARPIVYDRDRATCFAISVAVFDARGHAAISLQHRIDRGMGGDPDLDAVENLMCLCILCNTVLEQDAALAEIARRWGWKLRGHENPAQTAVWHPLAKEWRQLDPDGSFRVVRGRNDMRSKFGSLEDWR